MHTSARKPLTPATWATHLVSAALLAASVYAAVCIERSENIDPYATALEISPASMY